MTGRQLNFLKNKKLKVRTYFSLCQPQFSLLPQTPKVSIYQLVEIKDIFK